MNGISINGLGKIGPYRASCCFLRVGCAHLSRHNPLRLDITHFVVLFCLFGWFLSAVLCCSRFTVLLLTSLSSPYRPVAPSSLLYLAPGSRPFLSPTCSGPSGMARSRSRRLGGGTIPRTQTFMAADRLRQQKKLSRRLTRLSTPQRHHHRGGSPFLSRTRMPTGRFGTAGTSHL